MEGFNLFKSKKLKQESTLGKISKIAKFATLGTGLVVGANNLEAQEIPQNKDGNIRPELEKNINIENEKTEEVNGGNIEEVTVYSKRKYVDELKKQQEKYLADMAKYKQDSAQWVRANEAYQESMFKYKQANSLYKDSLFAHNATSNNNDIYDVIRKKYINDKQLLDRDMNNFINTEHGGNPNLVKRAKVEDYVRHEMLIQDAFKRSRKDILDNSKNISKKFNINPTEIISSQLDDRSAYIESTTGDIRNIPTIFKKPIIIPVKPETIEFDKPTKPDVFPEIKYDPKYENLKMRSLWANKAKADTTANIGVLNRLDYNDESKGFTIGEAMRTFPPEVLKENKIDIINNQIKDAENKKKEDYKHPGWNYENPEK